MTLTLEVTGPQAASLGGGSRHAFSSEGGIIGRARSSDWVLSHTKVSGRHAVITFMDGVFYIEDTSTNGVFLNSPKNRLVAGRRYALQSGDRIYIDPYEIDVSVSAAHDGVLPGGMAEPHAVRSSGRGYGTPSPFDVEDPFGMGPAPRPTPRAPAASIGHMSGDTPQPVPGEELDPLKLLGGEPGHTPVRKAPTAQELDARHAIGGHYQPPRVLTPPPEPAPPGPTVIPADYDPLRDDFTEPAAPAPVPPPASARPTPPPTPPPVEPPVAVAPRAPTPVYTPPPVPAQAPAAPPAPSAHETAPAPPAGDAGAGLAAVLAGAGLSGVTPTPELARSFGQIFRVVVSGVMDVLRSRQQIKDEFRMRMTQFRPADNNPLKFSANVDDALHNLLLKRNPAYLEPVEAFEDAFDDLRSHQLAMLAGMRVAFESMLAEFDPDRLEQQFDRQLKRVPLLKSVTRLRYWDLYRDRRDEMAKDPDASFRQLFGEVFARAYEEQLNRLKAESRARDTAAKSSRPSGT
jgi:type VI secretion system FHA domain protein